MSRDEIGHSSWMEPAQIVISDTKDPPGQDSHKGTCYSKYADLYAPCVEEEDKEPVAISENKMQHIAPLTALDLERLFQPVQEEVTEGVTKLKHWPTGQTISLIVKKARLLCPLGISSCLQLD